MTAATTTTRPSVPHRRLRVLLPLAVVTALAVGGGSAAVKALSAGSSGTSQPSRPASSVVSGVDVPTLWATSAPCPPSRRTTSSPTWDPPCVRSSARPPRRSPARAKVSDHAVHPHRTSRRIRPGSGALSSTPRWTNMVCQGARPCDFARRSSCPSGARGRSRWWR